jgi:hypothetical protein
MKRFLLSMLVGISLSTAGAVVLARVLLPPTVWEEAGGGSGSRLGAAQSKERAQLEAGSDSGAPFTQAAAVEVVAARLGCSPRGDPR